MEELPEGSERFLGVQQSSSTLIPEIYHTFIRRQEKVLVFTEAKSRTASTEKYYSLRRSANNPTSVKMTFCDQAATMGCRRGGPLSGPGEPRIRMRSIVFQ